MSRGAFECAHGDDHTDYGGSNASEIRRDRCNCLQQSPNLLVYSRVRATGIRGGLECSFQFLQLGGGGIVTIRSECLLQLWKQG